MPTTRPSIYDEVPARYNLRRTFRDRDNLHTIPAPEEIAEAILHRARDFGPTPTEAVRRMLDAECAAAATRLSPDERDRVAAFDAAVGIGFGPVVRR